VARGATLRRVTETWEPTAALGEARARAARLVADAEAVQAALQAVARRAAASVWAGPVRDAFDEALRARLGELGRAAEVLRSEADRLLREALRCEPGASEPVSAGSGWDHQPGWARHSRWPDRSGWSG
jgi:hypothetical protein